MDLEEPRDTLLPSQDLTCDRQWDPTPGGSSSLRETGVQALGRESTLEALCMKTAQGSEGMWAESGHSQPQSHLQSPSSTLIPAGVLLNPTLVDSC